MRKLGKKPARPGAVRLAMSQVVRADKLPTPPATFGHDGLVQYAGWGVLGNDRWGDCYWAGAAHEHMLWTRAGAGPAAAFSEQGVLSDYSAETGFAGTPETDDGTDLQQGAAYRQKTGIVDASGQRHRIAAYMSLKVGDWDELMLAAWLFGAVGVGVNYPSSADDQFDAFQPWDYVNGVNTQGGHYVPVFGRNHAGCATLVTWGRTQTMTREFYEHYNDESVVYFCPEYVDKNKLSPEGFDAVALGRYLKELQS